MDELTKGIQDFLQIENPTDGQIKDAALMLLRLDRSQWRYNRHCKSPQYWCHFVTEELKKWLKIRLDNMTIEGIVKLEQTEMPKVAKIIKDGTVSKKNDKTIKGKRSDHDKLPEEIQKLWDGNAELYKQIKEHYNTLLSMMDEQPCDRYQELDLLKTKADKYRTQMDAYDSYVIEDAEIESK